MVPPFKKKLFPFMSPADIDTLDELYPKDSSPLQFHNVTQILTDYFFQCTARNLAQTYTKAGIPVFKSLFKHQWNVLKIPGLPNYGVSHGADIPFCTLLSNLGWQLQTVMLPFTGEATLARVMLKAFMDFGKCDDLTKCTIGGSEGSTPWPQYTHGKINLDVPVKSFGIGSDSEYDEKCEFYQAALDRFAKTAHFGPVGQKNGPVHYPSDDHTFRLLSLASRVRRLR
jgi:carboxylesterase type B